MSEEGQTEDLYHIKGSCESIVGDIEITNGYLYFHFSNRRHQLDIDSLCTCIINTDTTINSINDEVIIGRIDQSVNEVDWIKTYHASGSEVTPSKIRLQDFNLYISGKVFSSADLVIGEDSMIVSGVYSRYGYIACFNIDGEHQWSNYYAVKGWDSHVSPRDLKINSNNDVLLIANVSTQSMPNRIYFSNANTLLGLQNSGQSFVVVSYDSLGSIIWNDISNSLGYEGSRTIGFDNDNNLYVTGTFTSPIIFGNETLEGYGFSNDIFVVSYDKFGNKRWAQQAGGFGSDVGSIIHLDSTNTIHIVGSVTGSSTTFGAYETNPPSPGNSIFVAQMKLEPISFYETTPQQFGVSVYPNPSAGITSIVVQDEFLSEINIYNSFGQEVKTLRPQHSTSQVSIQDLPSGYYILDIHVESGKHVVQKLIVR